MAASGNPGTPARSRHRIAHARLPRMGLAAALLGASGFAVFSSAPVIGAQTSTDWPAYLDGPAHDSYNAAATSMTTSNIGSLQQAWRWLVPASPNSGSTQLRARPTVAAGVVYIGAEDGFFFAVSESTRKVLWSRFLGLQLPTTCPGTQGIISTATVASSPSTGRLTVYVNAPSGYLYALDAATGAVVWKGRVDKPSATVNDYYSWGSPLVAYGKVYVGISSECDNPLVRGGLIAFDQATGTKVARWNALPAGEVGASIWSSPAAAADGRIFATTGNGFAGSGQPLYDQSIVALDASTLKLLDHWQVAGAQQIKDGDFGASPTLFPATLSGVVTPMVGACNKNGYYYAFRQHDLAAGPVWKKRITEPYPGGAKLCAAAAVWNGTDLIEGGGAPTTINGVTYQGSVQALDPATGKPAWATGLQGTIVGSPAEDGGGVVTAPVFQSSTGQLGVYLLNAATGAVIGFIATPHSPLFGQAVFAGRHLLIGGGPGTGLTAYRIPAAVQVDHWGAFFGDGISADRNITLSPVSLTFPAPVVQVATSNSSQYALLGNGRVYAWGQGTNGQLGNGATANSFTAPVRVRFPSGVTIASLATDAMPYDSALAIDTTGRAWGWGLNQNGELCLGNKDPHLVPVPLPFTGVTSLAGASGHAVYEAVFNGTRGLWSCGNSTNGVLGNGSRHASLTPVAVTGMRGVTGATVCSAFNNAGVLLANGEYYDWGTNALGQLGTGSSASYSAVPVRVPFGQPVTQVAQGGSAAVNGQTLVMLQDGSLRSWGSDTYGQLGDGQKASEFSPVAFSPPAGVTYMTLATGGATSYAISRAGTVYAWGHGNDGQIGNGGTASSLVPVAVDSGAGLLSATAEDVAAGP